MSRTDILSQKIGKIVADDFRTAGVFTRHGIDFCCGGGVTLETACQRANADMESLIEELQSAGSLPQKINYKAFTPAELINHVEEVHHAYVRSTMPVLHSYLDKLCRVHGPRHPELYEIREEFFEAEEELSLHMKKEEMVLFPYLLGMYDAMEKGYTMSLPHFGHVENPIEIMENEHETEGQRFRKIAKLSSDYTPPAGACQTYKVAYSMLREFDEDLKVHIHLENNIIFPEARTAFDQLFE
jgi:regulator of cell morphogenesis and NO signaling